MRGSHESLKQAWHWHNKQLYAVARNLACHWGNNSWQCAWVCVPLRNNSWQCAWVCGSGEIVHAVSWREFEMFKNLFQGVMTCHDEIVVPLSWTVRKLRETRRWVTRHANKCRDVNISKFSPRPGTHYPLPHAAPRTLSRFLPLMARQIACHGANRLSCRCQGRFTRKCQWTLLVEMY